MKALLTIISLLAQSCGILALYEVSTLCWCLFTLGTATVAQVHQIAWSQDLALFALFFSLCYFVAGLWYHFWRTEPKPRNTYRTTGDRPQRDRDPD
jgi:hypothetical protein